ncbi:MULTISPECIES: ABC-2 transporter permease [Brevibacterium]|uniref:ABC transporter permease subunit n=1 Tax=Brevibacterium TaxID=1696 RepID=UPI000C638632|nr:MULTISPECIES: ABC transporter permease subunit [Brevibacterium]SMY04918.1 ABC-2 family transporter protein [Brevibacterium sp. 239c]
MTTADPIQIESARPRLRDCLLGEIVKILSAKSTSVTIALSIGVAVFVTVLITVFNDGSANPLSLSLIGPFLGTWLLVVLAANVVATEYSTGMIQQSLAVTPRRGRLIASKLLFVAAISLLSGLVLSFLCYAVGQLILSGTDRPSIGLGDVSTVRAVTVTGVFTLIYPLIAASLAFVTRHATGAVLLTLLIAFFPMVMAELGSSTWAEIAVRFAPGGPMESLTGQAQPGTVGYMETGSAVGVTIGWLSIFVAAAFASQLRRDE